MMFAVAAIGAAIFAWLEWRRPDQRNRAARVVAACLATSALVLVGYFTSKPTERMRKSDTEAVLFTQGATIPSATEASHGGRFALPRSRPTRPDVAVVPDVAFLRRHHPDVRHVRVEGSGLEPFELEAMEGVHLSVGERPSAPSTPTITFLHVPRQVALGARVEGQGRVDGLQSGEIVEISLESPDGTRTTTSVGADNKAGHNFSLVAPSPAAEGRFVWRLRMSRSSGENAQVIADERVGISIVKPPLPRVLALDGAPRIETAHLQRWFAEMGGSFRSRTLVGAGRYRFATASEGAADFAAVDAELLGNVDVVLLDRRALFALSPDERAALRAAVSEQGTGLLLVPSGEGATVNETQRVEETDFFLPWKIIPPPELETDDGASRSARLTWPGLSAPLEQAIPLDRIGVDLQRGDAELVRDTQGRPIVVSARRGRGDIAISLARDTWRWQLAGNGEAFAGYWSHVLSHLARRVSTDSWRIANQETAPLFVHQPVELRYSTAAATLVPAEVTSLHDGDRAVLPLAQDRDDSTTWRSTFWPRHAGWHRVSAAGGAHLDFFVHEAEEWTSLAPARQRQATELFAALQTRVDTPFATPQARHGIASATPMALFALFLLSSSYLWLERRRLR